MLNMIAAALAAAQPAAAAPAPATDPHAQHRQMDHKPGAAPGKKCAMMANMKDCCCKDKMAAKMDGEHAGHRMSADQHQNHKQ